MRAYIDMHCDVLTRVWMHRDKDLYKTGSMVDLQRLKAGGCRMQFFAVYMLPVSLKGFSETVFPGDEDYINKNLDIFYHTCKCYPDLLRPVYHPGDLEEKDWEGILGILTLEDGRAVDGRIENLDKFYQKGIRLITLTWNDANCFGAPNSRHTAMMETGLTDFGHQAVERMNELGMVVDVSHLSDGGFWDVAALSRKSKKPFVASHSNCRALNPHPRSMTDGMIRALAQCGGVMGVNFRPEFLTGDVRCKRSKAEDIVRHLRHMINVGGTDCAAIGTDFDGISGRLEIGGPEQMPLLFAELERAGFTETEIEKIACRNVERALKDAL